MKRGLVLGKFMPLHNGHISLIEFAKEQCDELIVLVCVAESEPIHANIRMKWIKETFKQSSIIPILFPYDESVLPNTSTSSLSVSKIWAEEIIMNLPPIDIVFSSEKYGDYLAKFMKCEHMLFDSKRIKTPVSASDIRQQPFKNWQYIPPTVRPCFVKKICIYGTESTGKTTLSHKLAYHFNTEVVEEKAREIIETTDQCTPAHLQKIAELHASAILEKTALANKVLIVDTDLNITCSYSRFLFNQDLVVQDWVVKANQFDLYLYLDKDAPFIQDGTRLDFSERNRLDASHEEQLLSQKVDVIKINGDWEERFEKAIAIIETLIAIN